MPVDSRIAIAYCHYIDKARHPEFYHKIPSFDDFPRKEDAALALGMHCMQSAEKAMHAR